MNTVAREALEEANSFFHQLNTRARALLTQAFMIDKLHESWDITVVRHKGLFYIRLARAATARVFQNKLVKIFAETSAGARFTKDVEYYYLVGGSIAVDGCSANVSHRPGGLSHELTWTSFVSMLAAHGDPSAYVRKDKFFFDDSVISMENDLRKRVDAYLNTKPAEIIHVDIDAVRELVESHLKNVKV